MESHNNTKSMKESKMIHGIFLGILATALLLGSFGLGVKVGYRKAHFSFQWAENYHRNFGGPERGWMGKFDDRQYMDASGNVGQILKVDGNLLTLKGHDNVEKIVLLTEKTTLRRGRDTLKPNDLKANDFAIVIGEPNEQGQIEAKFVRLMPPPQEGGPLPPPVFGDSPAMPNTRINQPK